MRGSPWAGPAEPQLGDRRRQPAGPQAEGEKDLENSGEPGIRQRGCKAVRKLEANTGRAAGLSGEVGAPSAAAPSEHLDLLLIEQPTQQNHVAPCS